MSEVETVEEFNRRVEVRGECFCGDSSGHAGWLKCLSEAMGEVGMFADDSDSDDGGQDGN